MIALSARTKSIVLAAAVATAAFVVRMYYTALAQVDVPLRADAGQYMRIAMNVVRYGIFSVADPDAGIPVPDSYRAPGYPAFVAAILFMTGDIGLTYLVVLTVQAILGALVAMCIFLIAKRFMPLGFSVVAGCLVAAWPHLITQGGYMLTESFFSACLVFAIYFSVLAKESGRTALHLVAGAFFAAAALVNQVILLFPLVVCVLLIRKQNKIPAIVFLVAALVPPASWAIRDYDIAGLGGRSSGGRLFENVLLGIEPDFNRYYRDQNDARGLAARERLGRGSALYAADKHAAYAEVFRRVSSEPWSYATWFAQKPFLLWAWSVGQGAGDLYIYPMLSSPFETIFVYRLVASVCHGVNGPIMFGAFAMTALFLYAAYRRRLLSTDWALCLCVLVFCYATVVYTLLTPDARYANPFRPFELLLAIAFMSLIHAKVMRIRAGNHEQGNVPDGVESSDLPVVRKGS